MGKELKIEIYGSDYYDLCQSLLYDYCYGAITESEYDEGILKLSEEYIVLDD